MGEGRDEEKSPKRGRYPEWLRKALKNGGLSFREFVEKALYDPVSGYYARPENRVGKGGDFITAPLISPVFGHSLAMLANEFLQRTGDGLAAIVDIGCGDGTLIRSIAAQAKEHSGRARFFGVDRSLSRAVPGEGVEFVESLDAVPRDASALVLTNELFDALPFWRVVMRPHGLQELTVVAGEDGELEWSERPAPPAIVDYFSARDIALAEGQFADVTPEWQELYAQICARFERALVVTFDYGYEQEKLFEVRFRRFGTAAAYAAHQVTRDLLANPGGQDLTAHINFTDLTRGGEREGYETLFWGRQAAFLVTIGALTHPLFAPIDELSASSMSEVTELMERREAAQRLIIPDGIGQDIRVLVQQKGLPAAGWSFQNDPFRRR